MQNVNKTSSKYKKLKMLLTLIVLGTAGFFTYKYVYIYFEKRSFDKTGAVITKLQDDLRIQGIPTTSFKTCEHAQVKYGEGPLSCHLGIIYEGNEGLLGVKEPLEKFILGASSNKFSLERSNGLSATREPIVVATSNYSLADSPLGCSLSYTKDDDSLAPYTLIFSCGKTVKFALY